MTQKAHTFTTVIGTVLAMLLTVVMAPVAAAMPSETEHAIEIHKLEQSSEFDAAANGLPQDVTGHTPVSGSTFIAKRVPGIDVLTQQGQREAAQLSVGEAAQRVTEQDVAAHEVTDANGKARLSSLASGVYYVQETDTPAGYVGSEPFLIVLPLTHPVERDTWLSTVHAYPKDAKTGITLAIIDEDAVKLGDRVQWTSRSDIPRPTTLDGYQVEHIINPNLRLVGINNLLNAVTVSLSCHDCPDLRADADYELSYADDNQTLTLRFSTSGLEKLEAAIDANPTAQVQIDYETTVHDEGTHINEAVLYPSQTAIEMRRGVNDTATTKWGPLSILVHEHDNPANLIPDARFRLFMSLEDAHTKQHPVVINGTREWSTGDQGRLVIRGLRSSNFVNGLDRETTDPLYRLYWVAPTALSEGWAWVDETPLAGVVTDTTTYQTLTFEVIRRSAPPETDEPIIPGEPPADSGMISPPSEGELPMTGIQVIGLIVLAVALLGTGLLLRQRRASNEQPGNAAT